MFCRIICAAFCNIYSPVNERWGNLTTPTPSLVVSQVSLCSLCAHVTPPGPHHPNSFLLRAGLEPGIPTRWGGRSNKERQRLQPLVSVARAPLFEVRRVRFYTQPLLAYIRYTHPPKPHSRPGHGTNVTPRVQTILTRSCSERVSNPGFLRGRWAL